MSKEVFLVRDFKILLDQKLFVENFDEKNQLDWPLFSNRFYQFIGNVYFMS